MLIFRVECVPPADGTALTTGVPGLHFSPARRKCRSCGRRAGLHMYATPAPDLPRFPSRSDARTIQWEFLRPTENRARSPDADRSGRAPVLREFSRAD